MSKGYWIAHVDVKDADLAGEAYGAYVSGAAPAFQEFGAKLLARGGKVYTAEGVARSRTVVIEFPSFQAAIDCYNSPAYQAASVHRHAVSTAEIVIVEGIKS